MVPRIDDHIERRPPPNQRLLSVQSTASKYSAISHSSSFEADDERSTSTEEDSGRMTPNGSIGSDVSVKRYQGEDTRPTSEKELAGWYMYAFAAETYVICAISSFIPILLESLARENGVLLSDRTTPCGDSTKHKKGSPDDGQCIVTVLGIEINTASFAMYTFSISVLLQALLVVSISCAADHGNYRKRLLLIFAWIGSFSVMAYIFVSEKVYILGALLAIISNTAFGASFVLLNSFLPLLVRHHPKVKESAIDVMIPHEPRGEGEADSGYFEESADHTGRLRNSSGAPLFPNGGTESLHLRRIPTHEEQTSIELQLSTQISAKGIGIGYSAALFVQCVSILMLVAMKSSTWSQRVVLLFIGAWWTIFTVPAALWLRPRPGPPLTSTGEKGWRMWLSYVVYSWKNLFRTIKLARRLVDITLFLAGWFLLSDAVATTSSTAILFAKTQLGMKPWALGMINVISTTTGVMGAFSWSFISRHFKLKPHQTILSIIAVFEIIPIYGLLGYLPFVRRWEVFGLQQPWEMYPLAAVYGFVLGGLGSYCRSLYGELIPPGSEAAFYALYAITDKGSSIFGPTIVGAIIDASGEIRPAFWFLAALVGLPAPIIYFINVERGKAEGEKLAEVIEGFKSREDVTGSAIDGSHNVSESQGMLAAYDGDDEDNTARRETR